MIVYIIIIIMKIGYNLFFNIITRVNASSLEIILECIKISIANNHPIINEYRNRQIPEIFVKMINKYDEKIVELLLDLLEQMKLRIDGPRAFKTAFEHLVQALRDIKTKDTALRITRIINQITKQYIQDDGDSSVIKKNAIRNYILFSSKFVCESNEYKQLASDIISIKLDSEFLDETTQHFEKLILQNIPILSVEDCYKYVYDLIVYNSLFIYDNYMDYFRDQNFVSNINKLLNQIYRNESLVDYHLLFFIFDILNIRKNISSSDLEFFITPSAENIVLLVTRYSDFLPFCERIMIFYSYIFKSANLRSHINENDLVSSFCKILKSNKSNYDSIISPLFKIIIELCNSSDTVSRAWLNTGIKEINIFLKSSAIPDQSLLFKKITKHIFNLLQVVLEKNKNTKNKNDIILPILSICSNTSYNDISINSKCSSILSKILSNELLDDATTRLRRALKIGMSLSQHYDKLLPYFELISLSPLYSELHSQFNKSRTIELLKLHVNNILSTNEIFENQILLLSNIGLTFYRSANSGWIEDSSGLLDILISIFKRNFQSQWLLSIILNTIGMLGEIQKYSTELIKEKDIVNEIILKNWTDPMIGDVCLHCASILGQEEDSYKLYIDKNIEKVLEDLLNKNIKEKEKDNESDNKFTSLIEMLITIWKHNHKFSMFKRKDIISTIIKICEKNITNIILLHKSVILLSLMIEKEKYQISLIESLSNKHRFSLFLNIMDKVSNIKEKKFIQIQKTIILSCLNIYKTILIKIEPDKYKSYFGENKDYIISFLNVLIKYSSEEVINICKEVLAILITESDISQLIKNAQEYVEDNESSLEKCLLYLDYLSLPYTLNKFNSLEAEKIIEPMNFIIHHCIQQIGNEKEKDRKKLFDKCLKCILRLFNINNDLSLDQFVPVLLIIVKEQVTFENISCLNILCKNERFRKLIVETHPELYVFPPLHTIEVDKNSKMIKHLLKFIRTLEKEELFKEYIAKPQSEDSEDICNVIGNLISNTNDFSIIHISLQILSELIDSWGENPLTSEVIVNSLVKVLYQIDQGEIKTTNNTNTNNNSSNNLLGKNDSNFELLMTSSSNININEILQQEEDGELEVNNDMISNDLENILTLLGSLFQNSENTKVICSYSSNGIKTITHIIETTDNFDIICGCLGVLVMICQTEDGVLCVTEYAWADLLLLIINKYSDEDSVNMICTLLSTMFGFESMLEELCEVLVTSELLAKLTILIPTFENDDLNQIQSDLLTKIAKSGVYLQPAMFKCLNELLRICNKIEDANEKQLLPMFNNSLKTLIDHLESENYQKLFVRIGGINCSCMCIQTIRKSKKYKNGEIILKKLIELLDTLSYKGAPIENQVNEFTSIIKDYEKKTSLFDPIFSCIFKYSKTEENCALLISKDIIETTMTTVQYYPSNITVQSWACKLFDIYSQYNASIMRLLKHGVLFFIMMCLRKFIEDSEVLESSANILSRLICNDVLNDFVEDDGITIILEILKKRCDIQQILEPLLKIVLLVMRNPDYIQKVLNSDIINIGLSIMLMYTDESLHEICKEILRKCINDNVINSILKEVDDSNGNDLIKGLSKITVLFSIPSIQSMVPADTVYEIIFPILDRSLSDPTVCRLISQIFGLFEFPQLIEKYCSEYDLIPKIFDEMGDKSQDSYVLYSLFEVLYAICLTMSFAEEFCQTNRLQLILSTVKLHIREDNIISSFIRLLNRIGVLLPIDSVGWSGLAHSYTISIYKQVLDEIILLKNREMLLKFINFFIIISRDSDTVRIENIITSDIKDNILSVINVYLDDIELLYHFLTLITYWIINDTAADEFLSKTLQNIIDILSRHKNNAKLMSATLNYLVCISRYQSSWNQFLNTKSISKIQAVIQTHLSVPSIVASGNILLIKSGKELSDKYMIHVLKVNSENPDIHAFTGLFEQIDTFAVISHQDALHAKHVMENRLSVRILKIMEKEVLNQSNGILLPAAKILQDVELTEEIAQLIAEENCIPILLSILKKNLSTTKLIKPLLYYMSKLCLHDSLKTQIYQNDGIDILLDIWNNCFNESGSKSRMKIINRCCICLSNLTFYKEDCVNAFLDHDGSNAIKYTLQNYSNEADLPIINSTLNLLSNLLYENIRAKQIISKDCLSEIIRLLDDQSGDREMLEILIHVIGNIASYTDNIPVLFENNIILKISNCLEIYETDYNILQDLFLVINHLTSEKTTFIQRNIELDNRTYLCNSKFLNTIISIMLNGYTNNELIMCGLEILLSLVNESQCAKQMREFRILELMLLLFDIYSYDIIIMEYSITLLNSILNESDEFVLEWVKYHGLELTVSAIEVNIHNLSFIESSIDSITKCVIKVNISEDIIPSQLIPTIVSTLNTVNNKIDSPYIIICFILFEALSTLGFTKTLLVDGMIETILKNMKMHLGNTVLLEHGLNLISLLSFDPKSIPEFLSNNVIILLLTIVTRHFAKVGIMELVIQAIDNFITVSKEMRDILRKNQIRDFFCLFQAYESEKINGLLQSLLTILGF